MVAKKECKPLALKVLLSLTTTCSNTRVVTNGSLNNGAILCPAQGALEEGNRMKPCRNGNGNEKMHA